MSRMEYHSGKIRLIPRHESQTLENQIKHICIDNGWFPKLEHKGSWRDLLSDKGEGEYIICKDSVYKVIKHNYMDDDEWTIKDNGDGTFTFALSFYNGGCDFEEAIEMLMNGEE